MITMYYDDTCPVCRTEALHMAEKKPDAICIMAIDDARDELAKFGISENEAMTYLCVQETREHAKRHGCRTTAIQNRTTAICNRV